MEGVINNKTMDLVYYKGKAAGLIKFYEDKTALIITAPEAENQPYPMKVVNVEELSSPYKIRSVTIGWNHGDDRGDPFYMDNTYGNNNK